MISKTYSIKGMHCASCASVIEMTLKKVEGVISIEANYGTETAKVTFDEAKITPENLSLKLEPFGYSFIIPMEHSMNMTAQQMGMSEDEHAAHTGIGQSKQDKLKEIKDQKNGLLFALPLATISTFIMGWDILAEFQIIPVMNYTMSEFFHHLLPIMATYILFVIGKPYILGMYRFFRYGKANMDSLIGIGTFTAFLYSFLVTALEGPLSQFINVSYTYYDVTIIVITFIALGKYLESTSKLKTGDAIEKFPLTALSLRGVRLLVKQ